MSVMHLWYEARLQRLILHHHLVFASSCKTTEEMGCVSDSEPAAVSFE